MLGPAHTRWRLLVQAWTTCGWGLFAWSSSVSRLPAGLTAWVFLSLTRPGLSNMPTSDSKLIHFSFDSCCCLLNTSLSLYPALTCATCCLTTPARYFSSLPPPPLSLPPLPPFILLLSPSWCQLECRCTMCYRTGPELVKPSNNAYQTYTVLARDRYGSYIEI